MLNGKRVLVTGGTGSLGKAVIRRLLTNEMGQVAKIVVFSRDEAKQHDMRLSYLEQQMATDEIIYRNVREILSFQIGDIRDYSSVLEAMRGIDVIINAAAMKQVPTCEYFPFQAVQTNIIGPHNVIRAIRENNMPIERVIGVSTDKACKPINVMGMTKAIQERLFIEANIDCQTRFVCVRYGNVIASRGSVVPLFLDQIVRGGPVTVTVKEMTRFLLSLDRAVDTVFAAIRSALPGETYIPWIPSARVDDLAMVLINGRDIPVTYTGIRPGEKIHEILISEEECHRTIERDGYYVICPILPELRSMPTNQFLSREYSSADALLDYAGLRELLRGVLE